ncbi:MAG: NUDIX hydrolase [Betaproteobacteria bacterium]|jgi:ADP-ribose pyrophosphatase
MDKTGSGLVETLREAQTLLEGGFLTVRLDTVGLPDGSLATREYVVHPGAVAVVPVLDDGRVVMVRQFRYPLGQVLLEFPAGKIDPGEPVWDCARRELREETGYTARQWARACHIHNAAAYSTEGIEIWFARGLEPGAQALDPGEFLEVVAMSEEELDRLAHAGELTDVKTLVGLQWLRQWRRGEWSLSWVTPGNS